jgi:hypothetical protein
MPGAPLHSQRAAFLAVAVMTIDDLPFPRRTHNCNILVEEKSHPLYACFAQTF